MTLLGNCDPIPVVCNDNNACTNDSCFNNVGTAQCIFTPFLCPQPDPCSPQTCSSGSCIIQPVQCNDNNLCTTDTCSSSTGVAVCVFTPVPCTPPDSCHTAACASQNGSCIFASNATNCFDGDVCTYDICDPVNGCQYPPISCDDNSNCTIDTCDSVQGCIHTLLNCDGIQYSL